MMDLEMDGRTRYIHPACQVAGDSEMVKVILEMPGVSKENLEIKVENSELKIIGRRTPQRPERAHLLQERPQGDYYQVYTLDETIDRDKIDAQLSQGLLTVTLPLKESEKPRMIKIVSE